MSSEACALAWQTSPGSPPKVPVKLVFGLCDVIISVVYTINVALVLTGARVLTPSL